LKVDGFINHQVETQQEYRRRRLKSSHAKSAKGAKKKLMKLYDLGVLSKSASGWAGAQPGQLE
jgi:hypothetical protein